TAATPCHARPGPRGCAGRGRARPSRGRAGPHDHRAARRAGTAAATAHRFQQPVQGGAMTRLAGLAVCCLLISVAPGARAESETAAKEASRHFQRGVDLDNEGDYRGALVEFKKAYALLPRASVLYDIGQTEYQLQ